MLDIRWSSAEPPAAAGHLLVVPVAEGFDEDAVRARFGAGVLDAVKTARVTGKIGDAFVFTRDASGVLERVMIVGEGKGELDAAALRVLAHDAVRQAQSSGCTHVVVDLRGVLDQLDMGDRDAVIRTGSLLAQGCELGTYAYERYIAQDKRTPATPTQVTFVADATTPAEGTARGQTIAACVARARDLANGPAGLVTPTFLAQAANEIAARLAGEHDVSITVLDKDECAGRKMGCFLGVAQGSDEPPKFIHLAYRPAGAKTGCIALIGKGVTFDSGGYSLKPTDGMLDMKMDMAGAAAVMAAFEGAVELRLPWEIHAVVAATENMVSGRAYRLGDILASNGKTVEINNTDAEGRLTLADAMVYSAGFSPDLMIDFATLTGACMVALGPKIAGVMTSDDALAEDWLGAADRCGESMWRLPLPDDLKEQLKSKIADLKNTGERWGGAITGGLFLSEFAEGRRWMHVDIAGPAMASKAYGVTTMGGTGFPVATILEFLAGPTRAKV